MSVVAKPLIGSKYAANTTTVEYVCGQNGTGALYTIIDKFTATNHTGGAVTISVWLVPSPETRSTAHLLIDAKSVAAGTDISLDQLKNHILKTDDSIDVLASAASSIIIRCSGREVI